MHNDQSPLPGPGSVYSWDQGPSAKIPLVSKVSESSAQTGMIQSAQQVRQNGTECTKYQTQHKIALYILEID